MAKKISHEVFFYKKKISTFFDRELTHSLTHSHTHSLTHYPPRLARGVVVSCTRLSCTRLRHRTCRTSRTHFASLGFGANGFSTERARLAGGHFASLVVSKKVPATWWDFRSFQKKCLLPVGIFIFFPDFENWSLIFIPIEKVFRKTANNKKITYFKLMMSEISANLKHICWPWKPLILTFEVVFFSDRKRFSQILENWPNFFHLNFISLKNFEKSEKLFGSLRSSLLPHRGGCQASGVVVSCTQLRCTRLLHRTCKTSQRHFALHGLGARGFSTEFAKLAAGTLLRSWFQKCAYYLLGFSLVVSKKKKKHPYSKRIYLIRNFKENSIFIYSGS